MQDVRYDARVPARVHQLNAASEQVEALQFDHSSNGSNGGAPPEDPTLRGCSVSTLSVHGGERAGRPRVYDSLTTPIVQARAVQSSPLCLLPHQAGVRGRPICITGTSTAPAEIGSPLDGAARNRISSRANPRRGWGRVVPLPMLMQMHAAELE